MAWRGLHLSLPARLSFRRNALAIAREGEEPLSVPLDDLGWIILDSDEVTLTSRLLSECAQRDVALILSDQRHLPCGSLLPEAGYHRQLETLRAQLNASDAQCRRFWRSLVRTKIQNQGCVLGLIDQQGAKASAKALQAMAARVKAGDPDNLEAQAAQNYWRQLFPSFSRNSEEDSRNAFLNYGYAILRSLLARELKALGFEPSLGVHHRGLLNPFNLADDLLEPFRPCADLFVVGLINRQLSAGRSELRFEVEERRALAGLPAAACEINGEQLSLLEAARRSASALRQALLEGRADELQLPIPCRPLSEPDGEG